MFPFSSVHFRDSQCWDYRMLFRSRRIKGWWLKYYSEKKDYSLLYTESGNQPLFNHSSLNCCPRAIVAGLPEKLNCCPLGVCCSAVHCALGSQLNALKAHIMRAVWGQNFNLIGYTHIVRLFGFYFIFFSFLFFLPNQMSFNFNGQVMLCLPHGAIAVWLKDFLQLMLHAAKELCVIDPLSTCVNW